MHTPPDPNQRVKNQMTVRQAAVDVVRALSEAGHVAYFAGGCVRDRLMGHEPADYDVATDARPEQVAEVFRRAIEVGESFGVMLVPINGHKIQVATFRVDGVYSDSRHPDSVTFSDAQHDAARRDFTINGLFEDPLAGPSGSGRLIDYVGGQADLEARIIRAIGDPHARLREDRLRMLRAVRFAARFSFAIEAETADAIRSGAGELIGISRERVGEEIKRMLADPNRAVAAWEMQYLGLDAAVLMEPNQKVAPTRLGRLPDHASYSTALAAWLLDRNDDVARWDDLRDTAERWADALMLSNDERGAFFGCLDVYFTLVGGWARLGVAQQKRLAASPEFENGLLLLQATDRQLFVDVRRRVIDLSQSGLSPAPLIDGNDLINLGMKPGPIFSWVLRAVYDAQLEGSIQTKDEAVRLARSVSLTPPDGR
ncbi:MAG: CCA tRNA nucleotidyltransferase [Phycisphaerales bacterium]|nr:CCA tRNA nucleotidyltransferase [Phycisphaerales bacterium]MCI0675509.1 CCA tRNA nucleotidyltransferase [Phycisphaerales bacterium]